MSHSPNYLFPFVLDILSHKPLLCETQENLLKDLNEKLKNGGVKVKNLKKDLETTVDLGKGLGILSVQKEEVAIPFLLNGSRPIISWARRTSDGVQLPSQFKETPSVESNHTNEIPEPKWLPKPVKSGLKTESEKFRSRSRSRTRSRPRSKSHSVRRRKRAPPTYKNEV